MQSWSVTKIQCMIYFVGQWRFPGGKKLHSGWCGRLSQHRLSLLYWVWRASNSWIYLWWLCARLKSTDPFPFIVQVVRGAVPTVDSLLQMPEGKAQHQSELASQLAGEPKRIRNPETPYQRHLKWPHNICSNLWAIVVFWCVTLLLAPCVM